MIRWGKTDIVLGLLVMLVLTVAHPSAGYVVGLEEEQTDDDVYSIDYDLEDPNNVGELTPVELIPIAEARPRISYTWIGSGNGNVPAGAVVGGRTANGETLYIGRVYYKDDLIPGKIHPSHQRLYISYRGREYKFSNYEVLVSG